MIPLHDDNPTSRTPFVTWGLGPAVQVTAMCRTSGIPAWIFSTTAVLSGLLPERANEYRAAIENYDPSVKLGNQTALNAARVPFASYVNRMHNRIHPIFADGFLGSLNGEVRDPGLLEPPPPPR